MSARFFSPAWRSLVLALGLFVAAHQGAAADGGEVRVESATTKVGPAKGSLLVVGGGEMKQLWPVFLDMAGGKSAPIVVIPTANEGVNTEDKDKVVSVLRELGATDVVLLHTRYPAEANREEFVAPLRRARAVWFSGGRQWRLADAYLGTLTLRELNAVLERGGVIGGSSAGATIQGSYLVRGAEENNRVMMSPGHEVGFAFLRNTAIDQHVNTRGRAEDLRPVLAKHPALLGIALDEATAIIVRGDTCVVVGAGNARFFPTPTGTAVVLRAGARFDLTARSEMK